jgi:hypothetical protein
LTIDKERLRKALLNVVVKSNDALRIYGTLGRHDADGGVTYKVRGQKNYLWTKIRTGNGAQQTIKARADVAVPHAKDLPVELRYEKRSFGVSEYVIVAQASRADLAEQDEHPSSGIAAHTHDDRYFRETEHINVSVGAADAGKPIKLNAAGEVDSTMLDLTGVDIGAVIHAAAAKVTPVDADTMPLIDSAASNVLKKVTWANIKATLKTYLDTLYGLLATANTWTANNAFNSTATSGSAVSVTRNLAAASTDAPVVSILQDHASDDQVALSVTQDGTAATETLSRTSAGMLSQFANSYSITEGSNVFGTGFFRGTADHAVVLTIVRDLAINALMGCGVNGDTFRRFLLLADGTLQWGDGTATRDTNLYRSAADILATDDELLVGKYIRWAGQKRITANFDKTNTTLATITGLSVSVEAGKAYNFRAVLWVTANATGGYKFAVAGTCTATAIRYQVSVRDAATGAPTSESMQTALGGAGVGAAPGGTSYFVEIKGMIRVNAAGTLLLQFAQNAASGTSSVLADSHFVVDQMT